MLQSSRVHVIRRQWTFCIPFTFIYYSITNFRIVKITRNFKVSKRKSERDREWKQKRKREIDKKNDCLRWMPLEGYWTNIFLSAIWRWCRENLNNFPNSLTFIGTNFVLLLLSITMKRPTCFFFFFLHGISAIFAWNMTLFNSITFVLLIKKKENFGR